MNPRILNLISAFLIFGLPWFVFTLIDFRDEAWTLLPTAIIICFQLIVLLVIQVIAYFRSKSTSLLRLGFLGLAWLFILGLKYYDIQRRSPDNMEPAERLEYCQAGHIERILKNEMALQTAMACQADYLNRRIYFDGSYEEDTDTIYSFRLYLVFVEFSERKGFETKIAELKSLKGSSIINDLEYDLMEFKYKFPDRYSKFKTTIEFVVPDLIKNRRDLPHPCHFSIKKESGNSSSEEAGEGTAE